MTKTCSVPQCGNPHQAKGLCVAHYMRWRRHGDPLAGRTADGEPMRFYREVVMAYEGDECLKWPYAKSGDGYGTIKYRPGVSKDVHRLVCEEANGPPPTPEHHAAHLCGNGHDACCAKRHLVWKTPAENEADKIAHGTHSRGERSSSAKLARDQVLAIRAMKGIEPQRSIAVRYGVSQTAVNEIQAGRRWSWL